MRVAQEDGSSYSVWAPCGDRILETWRGEECDDGDENADAADACRLDCKLPTCGDEIVDSGEGCDQGDAPAAPCRLMLSQHNAPGHARTGWVFTTTTCGEWVTLPPDKKDDASSVVVEGDGCQMIAADGDGGASPFSSGGQVYHQGTYSGRGRMLTGNDNINSMLLSCAGNSADGTCDGSCQPTCSCQALAAPIGGSIEYTGGHPLCGSQVAAYSCAAGPLQGGDASRACGAFGAWSGTAPTHCGCPSLPAVAGMSIARSSGDAVGSVAVRPTKPLPVASKSQSLSEQADRALGARGRPTAATRARRCRAATRRARARRTAIGQAARPRTVGAPS